MRKDFLTFGEVNTADYGVWIDGRGVFNAPERQYKKESVPGRNGDILIDLGRYNNTTLSYDCFIIRDFAKKADDFRNMMMSLTGYQRLEDTLHPMEYRLAKIQPFDMDVKGILKAGTFRLEFDCKPQRFLKSGEIPIEYSESGIIYNPTRFPSAPLIRIYGSGESYIGHTGITITGTDGYIDIDCGIMDAYKDGVNMNAYMELSAGEFPKLNPGENNIRIGSGISKILITPRWYVI